MGNDRTVNRRSVLQRSVALVGSASVIGLAGCLGGNGGDVDPDDYPNGEVEMIVPFSTGGGFDEYTRLSEPYWEEELGGDFVTRNIEGGGGATGITQVYNAEPNGQTFSIYDSFQGTSQMIGRDVPFDITEMSYIGSITNTPGAFVVTEDADIDDWDDFINRIDEFNFATQGQGSYGHTAVGILSLYIDEIDGTDINYVHFNGTGEVIAGLERGEANVFYISTITSGVTVVKSLENASLFTVFETEDEIGGFLEEEGVETDYYSPELDVENIEEFNESAYDRRFFLGPPDVPEEILKIQRDGFQSFINDDGFQEEMRNSGRPIINPGGPDAVKEYVNNAFETLDQDDHREILESYMN
ncbi:Bug family tripartite tricarboxylate transporter substrate binding protein [Natrinema soli]|uniref:Bug family tripartite tricarboxylate transporter substrate binding protein n=1 Tax=Natrinema soli TaxID=1930624 RepID=A0ABD5STF2_9EURY|nr:tripartite tricarboxylate transporter substrate-binding protein [Natrinema soli]